MNGLNNFDETDREYSLAHTVDLIRFWKSKVKGGWTKTVEVKSCEHHILWTNYLSNRDETYKEDSLAPTDDLIRFWRSRVKITAGRRDQMNSIYYELLEQSWWNLRE